MSKHNRERRTFRHAEKKRPSNFYELVRMHGKGRKRLTGQCWNKGEPPNDDAYIRLAATSPDRRVLKDYIADLEVRVCDLESELAELTAPKGN